MVLGTGMVMGLLISCTYTRLLRCVLAGDCCRVQLLASALMCQEMNEQSIARLLAPSDAQPNSFMLNASNYVCYIIYPCPYLTAYLGMITR